MQDAGGRVNKFKFSFRLVRLVAQIRVVLTAVSPFFHSRFFVLKIQYPYLPQISEYNLACVWVYRLRENGPRTAVFVGARLLACERFAFT